MTYESTATTVSIDLLKKYDRPGPRYTSYPTVPVWSNTVGASDYRQALANASRRQDEPFAIYCHIPFCKRRCYYCGCNTVITNSQRRVEDYIRALMNEVENTAAMMGQRRRISQLHFGGGTPNYLDCQGIAQLLRHMDKFFEFVPNAEKSMEIDPRVTTVQQLEFLAAAGFNRISMGVQDFDLLVQEACGRVQPLELVENLLSHCRRLEFTGINFDLIYGLPKQTVEGFSKTIDAAIALRPDRLAVYSFAYLPSSLAHQSKILPEDLPTTGVKYRLFATAVEKFTAAGYRQIGMDHFALPEDELTRAQADGRLFRNFMGYTVQHSPEMVGFGMSSIGYIDNAFFQNHSKLDSYQNAIAENQFATYRGLRLNDDDLLRQYLITQLMCNFRLNYEDLAAKFGVAYNDYFGTEHKQLGVFFDDDLLREDAAGLTITPVGRTFVRNIAMTYDAYLNGSQADKTPTFSRTI
ncbi:MAG: oxygen-independent coproporphyrinogen III oxidase [candidate division Zixibacteria bacterium]|nr:oxygen-independent coproporphyrinogen III oxidase [candidate division Zixibacteria bacterium]